MAESKEILCLANSIKHLERCVAGIEVIDPQTLRWVRPVSSRPGHGVSLCERRLQDGSEPQVLDVVAVNVIGPKPHGFQRENWLLDDRVEWRKTDRVGWDVLKVLEERPKALWLNGCSSSSGQNDRVEEGHAAGLESSLALIRVDSVTIRIQAEYGKRVVRAFFEYSSVAYALRVTDPVYRQAFLAEADGHYDRGEAFLTVSLSEPFNGYAYKLIAAIIQRSMVDGHTAS